MPNPESITDHALTVFRGERWLSRFVISTMVFLGAFLSFSLEPIVGRLITPFFGGAVHLWTVSLMVFQALLFVGYLYAHLGALRLGPWHLLILLLPLLQWPLNFTSEIAPSAPTVTLIETLIGQVSLPFAILCTTAVVAQSWWYSSSTVIKRSSPFFLYGISNLGAMVALFAYPVLVEPAFGVTVQRWLWSYGYLFYAGFTAWTWYLLQPRNLVPNSNEQAAKRPSASAILRWLALSAGPSALLLAITNVIAMEIGSFPMVWVIPLALYLGSFIFAFRDKQGSVETRIHLCLLEIALVALLSGLTLALSAWLLPLILSSFYALCLIANRQLYRFRPHPSQLTSFYLTIAFGGWVGGVFVSLMAPALFSGLEEYPVAILAVVLACWPGGWLTWWKTTSRLKGHSRLSLLVIGVTLIGLFLWHNSAVYSFRNFYGISKIFDRADSEELPPYRELVHGKTRHGIQFLNPDRQNEPLAYYYLGGALEQAMSLRDRRDSVAMVGLGAGDALAWFGAGENVTIFEIDPDMEGLARDWFTYLKDTQAYVRVKVGDARLNLQGEENIDTRQYGAVFVDAFSGDSIPIHLLTLEALDVYLSRLKENGIIVFHVSNRYYDLIPVLKAAANERGLAAAATTIPGKRFSNLYIDPVVVVMAHRSDRLTSLLKNERWSLLGSGDGVSPFRTWTDDYINILAPLAEKITRR